MAVGNIMYDIKIVVVSPEKCHLQESLGRMTEYSLFF